MGRWAISFNALCKCSFAGSIAAAAAAFQDEVEPLIRDSQRAVFLVDALRYEMAIELFRQRRHPCFNVRSRPDSLNSPP